MLARIKHKVREWLLSRLFKGSMYESEDFIVLRKHDGRLGEAIYNSPDALIVRKLNGQLEQECHQTPEAAILRKHQGEVSTRLYKSDGMLVINRPEASATRMVADGRYLLARQPERFEPGQSKRLWQSGEWLMMYQPQRLAEGMFENREAYVCLKCTDPEFRATQHTAWHRDYTLVRGAKPLNGSLLASAEVFIAPKAGSPGFRETKDYASSEDYMLIKGLVEKDTGRWQNDSLTVLDREAATHTPGCERGEGYLLFDRPAFERGLWELPEYVVLERQKNAPLASTDSTLFHSGYVLLKQWISAGRDRLTNDDVHLLLRNSEGAKESEQSWTGPDSLLVKARGQLRNGVWANADWFMLSKHHSGLHEDRESAICDDYVLRYGAADEKPHYENEYFILLDKRHEKINQVDDDLLIASSFALMRGQHGAGASIYENSRACLLLKSDPQARSSCEAMHGDGYVLLRGLKAEADNILANNACVVLTKPQGESCHQEADYVACRDYVLVKNQRRVNDSLFENDTWLLLRKERGEGQRNTPLSVLGHGYLLLKQFFQASPAILANDDFLVIDRKAADADGIIEYEDWLVLAGADQKASEIYESPHAHVLLKPAHGDEDRTHDLVVSRDYVLMLGHGPQEAGLLENDTCILLRKDSVPEEQVSTQYVQAEDWLFIRDFKRINRGLFENRSWTILEKKNKSELVDTRNFLRTNEFILLRNYSSIHPSLHVNAEAFVAIKGGSPGYHEDAHMAGCDDYLLFKDYKSIEEGVLDTPNYYLVRKDEGDAQREVLRRGGWMLLGGLKNVRGHEDLSHNRDYMVMRKSERIKFSNLSDEDVAVTPGTMITRCDVRNFDAIVTLSDSRFDKHADPRMVWNDEYVFMELDRKHDGHFYENELAFVARKDRKNNMYRTSRLVHYHLPPSDSVVLSDRKDLITKDFFISKRILTDKDLWAGSVLEKILSVVHGSLPEATKQEYISVLYECFDVAEQEPELLVERVGKALGFKLNAHNPENLPFLLYEVCMLEPYYFVTNKAHPFIIDAGSNIGMSILWFKKFQPGVRILGIEPIEATCALARQNVAENNLKDVELLQIGLSDEDGEAVFRITDNDLASTMTDRFDHTGATIEREEHCDIRRLSPMITETVDFLKIDIEGLEGRVLVELETAGKLELVENLFIEYHFDPNTEGNALESILALLVRNGFEYYLNNTVHSNFYHCLRPGTQLGRSYSLNVYARRKKG